MILPIDFSFMLESTLELLATVDTGLRAIQWHFSGLTYKSFPTLFLSVNAARKQSSGHRFVLRYPMFPCDPCWITAGPARWRNWCWVHNMPCGSSAPAGSWKFHTTLQKLARVERRLTLSIPSSKSIISQPFIEKCRSVQWDFGSTIVVHRSKAMKSQVLCTVWCDITGEAAGEV